ncbi:DUF4276 family protein [Lysobacter pythonis]|uniref:DUF4276 family protein n=1 Tax=Solilutibacter pythonis TaxID=2483112 RepID=A0A3M2I226_9GAMM|nr:DUF4276 family protein [Lysobacter pythonis]RMH94213.1 DUF4276 family protein [Lysobacter pythonis]
MTRLLVLVEGQSEEAFVKRLLAPHLERFDVYVRPVLLWTRCEPQEGGFRGGATSWRQIRESLLPLLGDGNAWVTTLLDFHALPADCPGHEFSDCPDIHMRVQRLQHAWAGSFKHARFIPFLALHEFEAWMFSSPDVLAEHFGNPEISVQVNELLLECGGAERINHGPETHPKARLRVLAGSYRETLDGPLVLEKTGLQVVRAQCPHFAAWLERLEALGGAGEEMPLCSPA